MRETIEWVPVAERLPDDEVAVLLSTHDAAEPVWIGYYDSAVQEWIDTEGAVVIVTHWSPMPAGPRG